MTFLVGRNIQFDQSLETLMHDQLSFLLAIGLSSQVNSTEPWVPLGKVIWNGETGKPNLVATFCSTPSGLVGVQVGSERFVSKVTIGQYRHLERESLDLDARQSEQELQRKLSRG
jgi:hypothetical protein